MRMSVFTFVFVPAIVTVLMSMRVVLVIAVPVLILPVRVGRAFVNAKLHALDILPLRALEVHVEIAEVELREFPFERGGLHAEIDERADGHVAADAGDAIEIEDFHSGKLSDEC